MATSVMHKQRTGSWSAIFPTEQVTQQQSALFVKKLLAVAISNVTYLRTIFPEHAFGDRCLEDLSLKILRDDSACPGACQVIQWVKGCFDALDRKYLRMIIVGIYVDADDPMTAVESYSFKFDYNNQKGITIFRNDEEVTSAFSEVETKKATIKLLRTIIVLTQTLQPLPDDVMMTMKLYYYDDVTPDDYEPPGFQPTSSQDFEFDSSAVNVRVGDVSTPFHSVKLRIKTSSSQFTPANAPQPQDLLQEVAVAKQEKVGGAIQDSVGVAKEIGDEQMDTGVTATDTGKDCANAHQPTNQDSSQEPAIGRTSRSHDLKPQGSGTRSVSHDLKPQGSGTRSVSHDLKPQGSGTRSVSHDLKPQGSRTRSVSHDQGSGTRSVSHDLKPQGSDENVVRCPCGVNEDDGLMVLCALCQVWQHAICFGFLEEKSVPNVHICILCSKEHDRLCTDPSLTSLAQAKLKSVCLWRRTVHACCDLSRLVTPGLARRLGVGHNVAQDIMERLEREGYIRPPAKGRKWGRVVAKDKLMKEGVPKYFKPHPPIEESLQDHRSENKDTAVKPVPGKSHAKNQGQDTVKLRTGMEQLSCKAADLSISAKQQKPLIFPHHIEKEEAEVRRSPRIRAKRVRSVTDESKEFELSCSQEDQCGDGEGGCGRKRRKASIASNSIMV